MSEFNQTQQDLRKLDMDLRRFRMALELGQKPDAKVVLKMNSLLEAGTEAVKKSFESLSEVMNGEQVQNAMREIMKEFYVALESDAFKEMVRQEPEKAHMLEEQRQAFIDQWKPVIGAEVAAEEDARHNEHRVIVSPRPAGYAHRSPAKKP